VVKTGLSQISEVKGQNYSAKAKIKGELLESFKFYALVLSFDF